MDGRWKKEGVERDKGDFYLRKLFAATVFHPAFFSTFHELAVSFVVGTNEGEGRGGGMDKSGTINESLETERYYPFLRKQCRSFFHLTRRQKLFISPSKESSTSRAEGLKRVKRVREGDRTAGGEREGGAKGDATEEGIEGMEEAVEEWYYSSEVGQQDERRNRRRRR